MIDKSDQQNESWRAEWCDMSLVSKADVQLIARQDTREDGLDEAGLLITEKKGRRVGVIVQSLPAILSAQNAVIETDVKEDLLIIYNNSAFAISLRAVPSIYSLNIYPCFDGILRASAAIVLRSDNTVAIISKSKIAYESFRDGEIGEVKISNEGELRVEVDTPWGEKQTHHIDMSSALQRDHIHF